MSIFAPTRLYERVVHTYSSPESDYVFYKRTVNHSPVTLLQRVTLWVGRDGRGYYSGHGHQIWLLNCIQTHITHSVTSPCFWCPQRPTALFSLFLSRGDSNESSTAQGHALLIAPLNEVIHNVGTLWHALADAHTLSSVRPRTYWNQSPSGRRCRKVNLTG